MDREKLAIDLCQKDGKNWDDLDNAEKHGYFHYADVVIRKKDKTIVEGGVKAKPGHSHAPKIVKAGADVSCTGLLFQLMGKRTREYSDEELWMKCREEAISGMVFPHRVEMPCGQVYIIAHPEVIPEEDVPCPCGDPEHWIVRYVDNRESGTPKPVPVLKPGQYFCSQCNTPHRETSKIGKKHLQYKAEA